MCIIIYCLMQPHLINSCIIYVTFSSFLNIFNVSPFLCFSLSCSLMSICQELNASLLWQKITSLCLCAAVVTLRADCANIQKSSQEKVNPIIFVFASPNEWEKEIHHNTNCSVAARYSTWHKRAELCNEVPRWWGFFFCSLIKKDLFVCV